MTLADAIDRIEAMQRRLSLLLDFTGEVAKDSEALRIVLDAAKRIDPCCESHSGDTRCRYCYEL